MGCFQCAPPSADLVGLLGTEVSNAEGAADRVEDVELLLRSALVDRVVVFDSDAGVGDVVGEHGQYCTGQGSVLHVACSRLGNAV